VVHQGEGYNPIGISHRVPVVGLGLMGGGAPVSPLLFQIHICISYFIVFFSACQYPKNEKTANRPRLVSGQNAKRFANVLAIACFYWVLHHQYSKINR